MARNVLHLRTDMVSLEECAEYCRLFSTNAGARALTVEPVVSFDAEGAGA